MLLSKILNKSFDDLFELWFQEQVDSDNFNNYIGFDSDSESEFMDEFLLEYENSHLDEKEIEYKMNIAIDNEIKRLALYYFEDMYNNFEFNVNKLATYNDSGVFVYRTIIVENITEYINTIKENKNYIDSNNKEFSGIGICWSWDKNKSEAHWGDFSKGNEILITGFVSYEYIDFDLTFLLNFDTACGEAEAEIRIKENAPIKIIKINDIPCDFMYRT